MTPQEGAIALRAVILFLGCACIVKFMWRPTTITDFRQRLFQIRHDLFLFMADGNISPSDKAYVHLRSTLNGLIHIAERIGIFRIAVFATLMEQEGDDYNAEVNEALSEYSPHVRHQLQVYWGRTGQEIGRHIRRIFWFIWILVFIVRGIKAATLFRRAMVRVTEAQAYSEECDDTMAA